MVQFPEESKDRLVITPKFEEFWVGIPEGPYLDAIIDVLLPPLTESFKAIMENFDQEMDFIVYSTARPDENLFISQLSHSINSRLAYITEIFQISGQQVFNLGEMRESTELSELVTNIPDSLVSPLINGKAVINTLEVFKTFQAQMSAKQVADATWNISQQLQSMELATDKEKFSSDPELFTETTLIKYLYELEQRKIYAQLGLEQAYMS